MGGNDYLVFQNNTLYSNTTVSPHEKAVFVGWVIGNLTTSIMQTTFLKKVYRLGARKFSFQNCGPIGCVPSSRFLFGIDGCWNDTELLARMHNVALAMLLVELERELPGFKYTLFDCHRKLLHRIMDCSKYGFADGKRACGRSGAYDGNFTCGINGDYFSLCLNPNEFVFFDPAHPTEHAYRQLSSLMWNGDPPLIVPHNLKSFFQGI